MRNILWAVLILTFATIAQASDYSKEEPVKHLSVPKVTTMAEAQKIFVEKTFEIGSKKKLDQAELQEIHIITYTLEQSVAYFNEHLKGESKELTKVLADVVENIHLNSENNRQEETKAQLEEYFELASIFIYKFWHLNKNA